MLSKFFSWLWRDASVLSDRTPPRLNRTQLVVLVLLAVLAALFAARLLLSRPVDSDTFWHLRTGEWILDNGAIPTTDIFSWIGVEQGLSWTPHEWLFDVGLWAIYAVAGFPGVYIVTSLAYGVFVLLVFLLAYRRSGAWLPSLIVSVVSMLGTATFLAPRPQVVTYALLTAVALLLEVRRPYSAVLVTLIGINLHGAVYPVYLGLFAFYCLPRRDWRPLLLAVACSVLTPLGLRLLPWPLFALDPYITVFQEYAPTVLARSWFLLLALVAIFTLVDRRRLPVWDGLLVLALSLMALVAQRHATLFFGIAWPMVTPFMVSSEQPEPDESSATDEPAVTRDLDLDKVLAAVMILAVVLSAGRIWGASIDPHEGYPDDAVSWIEQEGVEHLWNDWGVGGYLIYRGIPTFVDGRGDPFMPFRESDVTIGHDAADAHYLRIDPRSVVEKYDIYYVLVDKSAPMFQVLRQSCDFEVAYSDDDYCVFRTLPISETDSGS